MKMPPLTHRNLFIAAAVLVALAGVGYMLAPKDKGAEAQRVVTVETGTVEETVTAQGKLEPKTYVDVGLQVSGQLKKIHVDIGDDVKQGDPLVEVDPRLYAAKMEADQANLANATAQRNEQQANLDLARIRQSRNQQLIKTKAISKDAVDEAVSNVKAAQARVAALEAQIDQIQSTLNADKTNLEYTKVMAPMTGTVVQLTAHEGQTFNASQSAPTILQLADLDVMTVRAQVAEADVMRLTPGMEVYFTTLGSSTHRWKAKVRQILPTPELINDVVLFDVLIDADNKDRTLMNGMSTQVFFMLGRAENVPVLPLEALGMPLKEGGDEKSGTPYAVRVKTALGTERKVVHVGLSDRTRAEIRDGLAAGDRVVVIRPSTGQGGSGQRSGRGGGGGGGMGMGPRF